MNPDRLDVYQRVTDRIIADLEKGTRPWLKPWNSGKSVGSGVRPLRSTGEPYRGVNVLMLWGEASAKGFTNPYWMTFRQAKEYGANVRKGEHGAMVVYANKIVKKEVADNGDETERSIAFLKGYFVFNVEQIEGSLPARFNVAASPELPSIGFDRIERAESFVGNTGAEIRHGGNQAYHHNDPSYIQMPPFPAFDSAESYYATLLHELTHWTRVPHRLNREFGRKRWGDEGYAAEELVAEIGAAFLCADLGITPEPRADHASYIANWLTVLKNDKRAVFTAAAHAQAAADYLHKLQANATMAIAAD